MKVFTGIQLEISLWIQNTYLRLEKTIYDYICWEIINYTIYYTSFSEGLIEFSAFRVID